MSKIVSWFSAGAASAVATRLLIVQRPADEIVVARIQIDNEHPDNERFAAECEKWFGVPIITLRSDRYKDCWEVWEKRRYLVGPKGALCTTEMKKMVRYQFEMDWKPDFQCFGFTAEETKRADRFKQENPDVRLVTPLISAGLGKSDCLAMIERAGIELPAMYRLGYRNNNCIGCVKGGVTYWNKIRRDFPAIFDRMALLERDIGATILKLGSPGRPRVYLDELSPDAGRAEAEPDIECSLLCIGLDLGGPPSEITAAKARKDRGEV